jgi:hypothetical protein
MADVKLDRNEQALWNEVGSRGDAFRQATRDRAAEQVRTDGKMTEVLGDYGQMEDHQDKGDPDPESSPASPPPVDEDGARAPSPRPSSA